MADSTPPASKRRTGHRDGNKDRISRLPDEILSHILSFLPTKYAVLTGILSNRWRSIWTLVPDLDFDDSLTFSARGGNLIPGYVFLNFVNRVLILRNKNNSSCGTGTFRLNCYREYDPPHFNPWICSAIANDFREIDLGYVVERRGNPVELPRSLFTCEKLEVLKLLVNFRINIPNSICLPSLRVLRLIWIRCNGGSSTLETLISSCPVLEELFIDREWADSLETLVIKSCSLKSLNIRADVEEFDAASYYQYIVVVDAPNLVSFNLSYYLAHGILDIKSELRFLVNATIDDVKVDGEDDGPFHGPNLMELLNAISNVKFLTLSDNAMDYLGLAIRKLANIIAVPKFCNLTDLDVKMGGNGWLILPKLLECVPNLKHFIFHRQMNYESSIHEMPNYKPKCLSKLEMVDIKGFEGSQEEIELVRYILESAMALKKMMIYSKDMPSDIESTILKKLIRFRRSSKCCELMFF